MYHFKKLKQSKSQIVVKKEVECQNVLFSDSDLNSDTE